MLTAPVPIEFMAHYDRALPPPAYESAGAAGADLRCSFADEDRAEGLTLAPGARALIPTGLRMAIPQGYEIQIRPRSGLAFKQGLTVCNAPGTIDSDYRGEVKALLINLGDAPVTVAHGDRVAQMVLAPVTQAVFTPGALDDTARGNGGFGSTGVA
jgi:dUTP pyrophosphatase